jgi:hypothetical protein
VSILRYGTIHGKLFLRGRQYELLNRPMPQWLFDDYCHRSDLPPEPYCSAPWKNQKVHWEYTKGQLYMTMMFRPEILPKLIGSNRLTVTWPTTLELLVVRLLCLGCTDYIGKFDTRREEINREGEVALYHEKYLLGRDDETMQREDVDPELVSVLFTRTFAFYKEKIRIQYHTRLLSKPHMARYIPDSETAIRFKRPYAKLDKDGFRFDKKAKLIADEEMINTSLRYGNRRAALRQLLARHTDILYLRCTLDCHNTDAVAYCVEYLSGIISEVLFEIDTDNYLLWFDAQSENHRIESYECEAFQEVFDHALQTGAEGYFGCAIPQEDAPYALDRALELPQNDDTQVIVQVFIPQTRSVYDD